ncbi:unnamed protein product [Calypogeia fissa]
MAQHSSWLRKIIYLGHTKFLPMGHEMRSDPLLFSSTHMPYGDERAKPEATTFAYWKSIAVRVTDPHDATQFQGSGLIRWSILATLPYWSELKIRHLLDPMHIEGNVGKALIKAFYGEKYTHFREACEDLEMHPDVWIMIYPMIGLEHRPSAPWVLSVGQRRKF